MKIATVTKILCDNPIYFFKRYAINRCFYLIRDRIWFGISDLYAIKRYMRLSGMRLIDFVFNRKIKQTKKFYKKIKTRGKTFSKLELRRVIKF